MAAHRFRLSSLNMVMLTAALIVGVLSPAWPGVHRDEIVLSHDDGTPETSVTGQTAMKVAVLYEAPPSATLLVAVEIYIMDDGVTNPNDPYAPTTMPFTLWVWRPTLDGVPGVPANDGYVPFEAYACPEDTLVRVYLPYPIDLSDQSVFPDARFFVGLEWEHRNNPMIGLDTTDPSDNSLRWNWTTWELVEGNIMIHAVVSGDPPCVPEIILVDASGAGDYLTIQEGVDAADYCDTVVVAPGTYTGPSNRGITFGGRNVALRALDDRGSTVIDCQNEDRGFLFIDGEDESSLVKGFTVRNGTGSGGGVRCVNSWPTIMDCAFIACDGGSYGGGMYLNNALTPSPTVSGCLFADNTAALSGGGVLLDFSDAGFENCTFVGNAAPQGGAVACGVGSSPSLTNCILAFSPVGEAADCVGTNDPSFLHCCVYGNAGGDSLCGWHQENVFSDPLFCDPSLGDYHLQEDSPCASDNNPWSELIGAYGTGCQPSATEDRSWGAIKAMFR